MQTTVETRLPAPPTAPGYPVVGNALPFMAAQGIPVEYLQKLTREYGDLVHFRLMGQSVYLIGSPELVHEVLVARVNEFHKAEALSSKPRALGRFLGHGILTSDHEEWRPQRKLIQPLMHTKHITKYAEIMAQFGDTLLSQWHDGDTLDIHAEMTNVTMWIIAETMFGMDQSQIPSIERAGNAAQKIAVSDLISRLPEWMMGARDRQASEINEGLTNLVEAFKAERRGEGDSEHYDLLSLLMETRDEHGQPMSDEFIRDNILTLFFAGHETTANTLTWAFYYLYQHPEITDALHREVDTVLEGRLPTLADLPKLPYTLQVVKETMRIQPTVASFPRAVLQETELGGYALDSGSLVFIPVYVLHHDGRWWNNPEIFDPTRFAPENEARIPKYAYLPFGGGPRVCIGNHFALMEAQILLALIASRYTLHGVPTAKVEPLHQVTTFPKTGLSMRLEQR